MPVNPLLDPTTGARATVEGFIAQGQVNFKQLRQQCIRRANFVWANDQIPTPLVLEIMGTRAAALFEAEQAVVAALTTVDPTLADDLKKIVKPYTANPDGTVTAN